VPTGSAHPIWPASVTPTRRLQVRPGTRLGRQHEPAVVLAVAEHPQLHLLSRQARFLNVPAAMTGPHRAIGLQPRRVAQRHPVLKPACLQLQQAGQLPLTRSTTTSGDFAVTETRERRGCDQGDENHSCSQRRARRCDAHHQHEGRRARPPRRASRQQRPAPRTAGITSTGAVMINPACEPFD
jgi:hypothetical protein